MKIFSLSLMLLLLAGLGVVSSPGQGTAFTYQGQLDISNSPANGSYQMQFALYANNTGGIPTIGPVTNTAVAVTNGVFSTTIDFGSGVFTGGTNWLDIAVRTNVPAAFTELSPRQQILPVPYAIYSSSAGTANTAVLATTAVTASNLASGSVSGSSITPGTLTASDFAPGQVVTNINGLTGGVSLVITNNMTLTANGSTLTLGGGNDFLCAYLFAQTQSINSGVPIPVSNVTMTNGWGWNKSLSAPVFVVPATGYYLIHIDALPSTSNPEIGAYYSVGNGSFNAIGGSLSSGSPISHSFIANLTAGNNFEIANASTGTLQLLTALPDATLFCVTIIRIN